jgi:hypothetical protein
LRACLAADRSVLIVPGALSDGFQYRGLARDEALHGVRLDIDDSVGARIRVEKAIKVSDGSFIGWLEIATRDLVQFHWHSIECVAQLLLRRETINGREVAAVVRAA